MSWATSAFRWLDLECFVSIGRSSVSRWPGLFSSYLTPSLGLVGRRRWSWRDLSLSWIVDDVMWGMITAFESVALVSMLCFFFVFCGCTV
ncbi:hypothetical protein I3843_07G030600 [Carya illinoinensis]|uniref:Transmembrane protein n=1 Tax=Carya illinoinensis TaxID=32201 RepID=A0A8T1PX42_CARIL|nr:uncharacterized protein LOC122315075 [Carya illinoinensis]KAG2695824.1 hypothetical protein I3760_07G030100 [Carya illinoinensis]KAG6646768.1 hypothetical protein CIPAW_07G030900 [Carya illinoinensis]KAG6702394.1 hypothetical protein I3842_07G031600 [Carya illinoinensis]KAG7969435.1 hypothetical protein I3843_07G030600 [Carya illinoinensis]